MFIIQTLIVVIIIDGGSTELGSLSQKQKKRYLKGYIPGVEPRSGSVSPVRDLLETSSVLNPRVKKLKRLPLKYIKLKLFKVFLFWVFGFFDKVDFFKLWDFLKLRKEEVRFLF